MIEFWIKTDDNREEILLPVTPSSYEIIYAIEIETIRTTSIGDINVASHESLKSMTLESFFPEEDYVFARKSKEPWEYEDIINKWRENREPVRIIITDGVRTKVNQVFYIGAFKIGGNAESNGDTNYTLTLKEFKRPKKRVIKPDTQLSSTIAERDTTKSTPNAKLYTVISGDSLSRIARKMYGDASKWEIIYNANMSIIKNPNLIYVGQVFEIPDLPKSEVGRSSKTVKPKNAAVYTDTNLIKTMY